MKSKILLIEDDDSTRFGFVRYFSKEGYQVSEAATLSEATEAISTISFNAIILDISLPDGNGIDFIATARAYAPNIPIIVITGAGDIPLAVEAMQCGADNFLTKPVDNAALSAFLRKTLEIGDLRQKVSDRKRLERPEELFFGESPVMQEIRHLAQTSANSDNPVVIMGETGTGKGMLARWIHRQSARSAHEFVEINCSGLKGEMLSRELFGNARGAYTSADQDRKGLLDIADRGTLFLDEIGDMELSTQSQFLKVLEEKSYRRLGDVKLLRSDFRLLCATHHDIETLVQDGQFRRDLMYRINLMSITIPPLRERMDDLPALVAYLLHELGSSDAVISKDVMSILRAYSWPGNIRELKNVLERALMLSPRDAILRQSHFTSLGNNQHRKNGETPQTIRELEEQHIKTVLKQMDGDVEKTARHLNISRATLYRRLKQSREEES
ncbi:MAG: sigma-54-dependent Fis family transcriptional regulator [Desulfuromonadales bacterium]|nr:sigma-54-dependent Fis family transcriptional regulator [Desulfuromonadales bacterium]